MDLNLQTANLAEDKSCWQVKQNVCFFFLFLWSESGSLNAYTFPKLFHFLILFMHLKCLHTVNDIPESASLCDFIYVDDLAGSCDPVKTEGYGVSLPNSSRILPGFSDYPFPGVKITVVEALRWMH